MAIRTTIEQAAKSVMGVLQPGEGQGDILATLETEHDDVQELLERLADSDSGGREQKQLVEQIKRALVPHTKAEEKVVYDAVLALKGKDAKIDGNEGYLEHELADQTLKKLDKLTANTAEFSRPRPRFLKRETGRSSYRRKKSAISGRRCARIFPPKRASR